MAHLNKLNLKCYACDRVKNRVYYNKPTDLTLCNVCYDMIIRRDKWRILCRRQDKKRYRFKDKRLRLKQNPRVGVCNLCRAVVPFDTMKTLMHHEKYEETDPFRHTIEICGACHNERHNYYRGTKLLIATL